MKLNNIFLSLITLAALVGCSDEEVIDNPDVLSQEVPTALVLGADMGTNMLGTKSDTDTKTEKCLYAFVFDENGEFIGRARSASATANEKTIKSVVEKIHESNVFFNFETGTDGVTSEGLNFADNEVVITGDGFKMKKGDAKKVKVLLLVNPAEKESEFNGWFEGDNNKLSAEQMEKLVWYAYSQNTAIFDGVARDKRKDKYSELTASQWFLMTLHPGVNYVGKQNDKFESNGFTKTKLKIPLYRLVADVHFDIINSLPGNATFTITKIEPSKNYYSSSMVYERPIEIENFEDESSKDNYEARCSWIQNEETPDKPWNLSINNYKITTDTPFQGEFCLFEQKEPVVFTIIGDYMKGNVTKKEVTYTYTFEDRSEKGGIDERIRRNKIYTVELNLTTAPKVEGELIPLDGDAVKLEIANMATADPNFTFGEK